MCTQVNVIPTSVREVSLLCAVLARNPSHLTLRLSCARALAANLSVPVRAETVTRHNGYYVRLVGLVDSSAMERTSLFPVTGVPSVVLFDCCLWPRLMVHTSLQATARMYTATPWKRLVQERNIESHKCGL